MVFWSWMEERDCAGCAFFRRTTSARVVLPASFSFCSWSFDRLRAVMLWICAGQNRENVSGAERGAGWIYK